MSRRLDIEFRLSGENFGPGIVHEALEKCVEFFENTSVSLNKIPSNKCS